MERRGALAWGVGLILLAGFAIVTFEVIERPKSAIPKVTIGAKDEVYYNHAATIDDANALGHALQMIGFFNDRGATVLLSRNKGGTVVSFVLQQGQWNSAA